MTDSDDEYIDREQEILNLGLCADPPILVVVYLGKGSQIDCIYS